ncbi:phage virion morphogenesis protein [Endozoicomonas gorgoniicola]|uniref:Phage virion morphogenesis protein n=1 Tax=Endozoicomonas gorgoniicola TaxID=1234144 RepID=A0ABT3MYI2_9GAMM|nr:phage virion morphogenesis protein [Endozoicomonas gorgoniicola]MCW7554442.1 phage virion morphogenesis protein [Endozoicomonas gorgoniicola]
MAGVTLTQNIKGLEALAERLNQLASADYNDLLEQIGGMVESQTQRRLSEEKEAPEGSPWEPLSDDRATRKSEWSSGGMLEYQGHLLDSIAYQVSGDEVKIGTGLIYGAIHQLGGEPVGKPIPARPYLGLSSDNENELNEVIEAWLSQLL